mmetsp:Transcript_69131/g.200592  ORF Transcript_69131/g.200592 Transcript_69131/m.200592 type:complete len:701 (+) Transcript_69131:174-2276(+)
MVFGANWRPVVAVATDPPPETIHVIPKSRTISSRLSSLLGKKPLVEPVPVRSHEELTDLLGILLRLGLAVCSASPDDCMGLLQSMTNTEVAWLRTAGSKLLEGLMHGALGSLVDTSVTGFLAQGPEDCFGMSGSLPSASEEDSEESSSSAGDAAGGVAQAPKIVVDQPVAAPPELPPQRRRPSIADMVGGQMFVRRSSRSDSMSSINFLRGMLRRQGDSNQAVKTGDLQWTPDGCPVGDGQSNVEASQSVNLVKRYSQDKTVAPVAPAPAASDRRDAEAGDGPRHPAVYSLNRDHDYGGGGGLALPAYNVAARRPSNASLLEFPGCPGDSNILHEDSLLVSMLQAPNSVLLRHGPAQQHGQSEPSYHSQRLHSHVARYNQLQRREERFSSEGSVATTVLLDIARGGLTSDSHGDVSSLGSPSAASSSNKFGGRESDKESLPWQAPENDSHHDGAAGGDERPQGGMHDSECSLDVDAIADLVDGSSNDAIDPMTEAEMELDPVRKYEYRKRRLSEKKKEANKSGKVTYGSLLRSHYDKVDDEAPERRISSASSAAMSAPEPSSGEGDDDADPNSRWRKRRAQIRERRKSNSKNTYGRVIRSEHEQNLPISRMSTFDLDKPLPGVPDSPVGESFGAQVIASTGVDPALKIQPMHADFWPNFCSESFRRSWTSDSVKQDAQVASGRPSTLSPPMPRTTCRGDG